jgi:hypothetical protein
MDISRSSSLLNTNKLLGNENKKSELEKQTHKFFLKAKNISLYQER